MSRQSEHADDVKDFSGKHVPVDGSTEGGACLTGHESGRTKNGKGPLKEVSCNYRWQGFKQAAGPDEDLYKFPRYESLVGTGDHMMLLRFGRRKVSAPKAGEWDPGTGDNFRTSCNVPYWHESHHIVPHGELRDAINATGASAVGVSFRGLIRSGLLEEKYNLNHMGNMIILPMDRKVAGAIRLPRHRCTPAHFSHRAYSKFIRGKLDEVFKTIRSAENMHAEAPDYPGFEQQLTSISTSVRKDIIEAGGKKSLDQSFAKK